MLFIQWGYIKIFRRDSSIIYPAILDSSNMETLHDDLDEGATPAKRMKLSPRRSISINVNASNESQRLDQFKKRLSCYNSDSLLSTPIVKRRSLRNDSRNNDLGFETSVLGTPPSILKVCIVKYFLQLFKLNLVLIIGSSFPSKFNFPGQQTKGNINNARNNRGRTSTKYTRK